MKNDPSASGCILRRVHHTQHLSNKLQRLLSQIINKARMTESINSPPSSFGVAALCLFSFLAQCPSDLSTQDLSTLPPSIQLFNQLQSGFCPHHSLHQNALAKVTSTSWLWNVDVVVICCPQTLCDHPHLPSGTISTFGFWDMMLVVLGFPSDAGSKEPSCQCSRRKRCRFDPWVGKISWRRVSSPLQYSCLENPMDRRAWQAIVHRVAKSWTLLKWLSMHSCWLSYISFCIKLLSSAFFSKGMICIGSFNILDTNLLSVIWTANIFF